MITLITGAPGSGKSAALVAMLAELGAGRQLYVNGIPDLKISHEELAEPDRWPELVPDGSVVIIDEVQRVWRPRGPGQKVPDHVAMLETHRHRGLDFYIITQGPNLVDSNVRALVGRHVHLRDLGILGRWWYEWPECSDNCRTSWKNAPIKKRYRLPKQVFGQYKSASIHVKPVRSVPWMLVVMVGALALVAGLSWMAYGAIWGRMNPKPATVAPAVPPGTVAALPSPGSAPAGPATQAPPDERVDFEPRLSGRPWTAPAYDHLRQVVNIPRIAGGMCFKDRCTCVTQQGTDAGLTHDECRQWIGRRPFDPYTAPLPPVTASASAPADSPSVSTQSARDQSGSAPLQTANVVPMPSGVENPRADARLASPLPPGSAVHPVPPTGVQLPIAPPSLLSPYRRT